MTKTAVMLVSLSFFCAVFADEFYCKKEEGKYQICRKCISLDDKCEDISSECKCDNIAIIDSKQSNASIKICKLIFFSLHISWLVKK